MITPKKPNTEGLTPAKIHELNLERHNNNSKQLWRDIAFAVAGSSNCDNKRIPGVWADKVVEDYNLRYKPKPLEK